MTNAKNPQAALGEIGILKNVVLLLVLLGFIFFSWATIGSGFGVDAVQWLLALFVSAGFWYLAERFSTHPHPSLLSAMWVATVAFAVLWIGATVATIAIWDELDWATLLGVILSVALTFLMVRIAMAGRVCVRHPAPPLAAGPPAYSPPVQPAGPPAYGPPVQPAGPPAYGPPVQPAGPRPGIPCPTCGRQIEAGMRFCPYDGTRLPQECPSCGQVVAAGMRFCPHCGTPQSGT
jgi:hypothetical protein